MEALFPNAQTENQHICCPTNDQNGFRDRQDSLKEMHHQEMTLEENMRDSECGINSSRPSSSGPSDTEPSALVPGIQAGHAKNDAAEGKKIACTDEDSYNRNNVGHLEMVGHDCKALTTIKKEARFELRAFQDEKKPSKLFDCCSEKEPIRVKKVRDSEEMDELERERQELIHSQAVRKNPGIAAKWWNPPPIKTIEEELDPDQLESHRKYQERKQKKLEYSNVQQELPAETDVSFTLVEGNKKEDLLIEQMNLSTAHNQPQQQEKTEGLQTEVTPELCSGNLSSGGAEATHVEMSAPEEAARVKTQSAADHPVDIAIEQARTENEIKENNEIQENDGDLTCAQTLVTLLEEPALSSADSSCHNEETDSGLDDQSIQSQDPVPQELLSNALSSDNVSDSGASNEATNAFMENSLGDFSLPATPQATSPVDGETGGRSELSMSPASPGTSPTEKPIQHHSTTPVQNTALQASQTAGWEFPESQKESHANPEEVHHEKHLGESSASSNVKRFIQLDTKICDSKSKCNPPQVLSLVQEKQVAQEVPEMTPPACSDTSQPLMVGEGQPPQAGGRQEFSYFSKYSEVAELRSTASLTRPREPEVSSGPFRLRSHKQKTLSRIEEEIRAAQERELELKRQRQTRGMNTAPCHKERTTNIPTRLVVTAKTTPGKIHSVALAVAAEDRPSSPTLSDASSEGSEGSQSRPKNFMQTLMDDYEIHKLKRKEKMEDNRVLEATRVTRQKSNMAVQWEAGVYSNQEEEGD